MSQSADFYEHRLDEAQQRENSLEDKIAKLKDRIEELEDQNQKLLRNCIVLIEVALGRGAE